MTDRSLAEDEQMLANYSVALGDAVARVLESWFRRLIDSRAPGLAARAESSEAVASGADAVVTEMRNLLATDIAEQAAGPLELLRRAVRVPTAVLSRAEIAPVKRDDFSTANFPDDVYDLTPASFAAIDPSLHQPGLMWGAAKAHVHLRRRREADA